MSSTLTTVNIAGHGEFTASDAAMSRFESLPKDALCKAISEGYGGDPSKGGKPMHSAKHFRQFAKDDLVVMAADMFGKALERAGRRAADMEPHSKPEPLKLEGGMKEIPVEHVGTLPAEEPADLDNNHTDAGIDDVSEDYPGQHVTGPDAPPAPAADEAPAAPKQSKAAQAITSRDEAPKGYRLKVAATHPVQGWLRREQPRKPGDVAKYRVVEDAAKATVIKSRHQVELKLAEAATLLDVPAAIEIIA